jgi:hypothetical protein
MNIEIHESFKAQPLDDEGDPKGKLVELSPGKYQLISGFTRHDDGTCSVWVKDQNDVLYEAQGLAFR